MNLFVLAAAAISASSGAFAGGYSASGFDPVDAGYADSDWSGLYAGLQYGQGDAELSFAGRRGDEDFDAFGLHLGYQRDLGRVVLGGELDYSSVDFDLAEDKGDLLRLRARLGYDGGRFMPYVTFGVAGIHGDIDEDRLADTGLTYGIGADFRVTDKLSLGLDYTRNTFSDILDDVIGVSGLDLDTDLLQVRASYHF